MKKEYDLICFGEIIYDCYGSMQILGGAPLNTASSAAKLGIYTSIISAVGKDDYRDIKSIISKRKIEPLIQKTIYPTGKAMITLNSNKVPSFRIEENCSFDHIRINSKIMKHTKNARFLYFGSLAQRCPVSRTTLLTILAKTHAYTIYDVNLRKGIPDIEMIVGNIINKVRILKANEEELKELKKIFRCKNIINFLFKNTKISSIFVTAAKRGAFYYTEKKTEYFEKAPNIKVVDTTGCGDAFVAGIVFGLVNGLKGRELLKNAVKIASETASFKGAYQNT